MGVVLEKGPDICFIYHGEIFRVKVSPAPTEKTQSASRIFHYVMYMVMP